MPRPITTVHITPDFQKAYLRLSNHIQNLATRKDQWFRKDAFDPRLRTHKLKGELSAYWAYSVNREYRVLFRFLSSHEVIYYDVGTHKIYRCHLRQFRARCDVQDSVSRRCLLGHETVGVDRIEGLLDVFHNREGHPQPIIKVQP